MRMQTSASSGRLYNADLGATATVTYTANCSEVPPLAVSHISFVGAASATGTTVALPSGWQPGDMAIAYGEGTVGGYTGIPTGPGTWTALFGSTNGYSFGKTRTSSHVLAAGDGSVVIASSTHVMVAVYRGVASIGAVSVSNPGNNQNWGCTTGALHVTNGSSWVVCMGGDGTGTFNVSVAYAHPAFAGTVGRSSPSDTLSGLADTNGGVTAWAPASYASGDYGHGGANWGIELVSS